MRLPVLQKGSKINTVGDYNIRYDFGDDVNYLENPIYQSMALMNELLYQTEDFPHYEEMLKGFEKIDGITRQAAKKVQKRAEIFAQKYYQEPIVYVLSSGAAFANAYGFSISYGNAMDALLLYPLRRVFPRPIRSY